MFANLSQKPLLNCLALRSRNKEIGRISINSGKRREETFIKMDINIGIVWV